VKSLRYVKERIIYHI